MRLNGIGLDRLGWRQRGARSRQSAAAHQVALKGLETAPWRRLQIDKASRNVEHLQLALGSTAGALPGNLTSGANMSWHAYVTVDPAVLHGKACIRGTRIPV